MARGKERMGMGGGGSLGGVLPNAATGMDWPKAIESHVKLRGGGKPMVAARSSGVEMLSMRPRVSSVAHPLLNCGIRCGVSHHLPASVHPVR